MMHLTMLQMFLQALETRYGMNVELNYELDNEWNGASPEQVLSHMYALCVAEYKFTGSGYCTGSVYLDRKYGERLHRIALRVHTSGLANSKRTNIIIEYGWLCWGGDNGVFMGSSKFHLNIELDKESSMDDFLQSHLEGFKSLKL